MIKITEKMLRNMGACEDGVDWFLSHRARSIKTLVSALLKDRKSSYANWLIVRLMAHPQQIKFAIFAAEQVINLFEDKYPFDKRPRLAIQAAKDFLTGKITANAAYAAANAANAAANAAAYAANAAANAAADAAYAAYAANAAANAAYAANAATTKKILAYGLELLGEK